MEHGRTAAMVVVVDGAEAVEIQLTPGHAALVDVADWDAVPHLRRHGIGRARSFYVETSARDSSYATG